MIRYVHMYIYCLISSNNKKKEEIYRPMLSVTSYIYIKKHIRFLCLCACITIQYLFGLFISNDFFLVFRCFFSSSNQQPVWYIHTIWHSGMKYERLYLKQIDICRLLISQFQYTYGVGSLCVCTYVYTYMCVL